MFKDPFSFEGRIRRSEYCISNIIYLIAYFIVALIGASVGHDGGVAIIVICMIPMFWFMIAQGSKRCHDLGNSGWWQLIPLYGLWMLFADGEKGANQYGENPKESPGTYSQSYNPPSLNQPGGDQGNNGGHNNPGTGYQGGYSGGHNNPGGNSGNYNNPNEGGYKDGDLYK